MEPISGFHIFALAAPNFASGFAVANQQILLAPLECERLFAQRSAIGLAWLVMLVNLAQIVSPAGGTWSDWHRNLHGKRVPCLLKATGVVILFTLLLPIASKLKLGAAYVVLFFLQQIAWAILMTVSLALVPDLVPAQQVGTAGALAVALNFLGAFTGLFTVKHLGFQHAVPDGEIDYRHYHIQVTFTLGCTLLVVIASMARRVELSRLHHLPSSTESAVSQQADAWLWWKGLCRSYTFDPTAHPEYAKLLLYRGMYSGSLVVKSFMLFYIQDVFQIQSASKNEVLLGESAMAGEGAAGLAALAIMTWWMVQPSLPVLENAAAGDHVGTLRAVQIAVVGCAWVVVAWMCIPATGYGLLRLDSSWASDRFWHQALKVTIAFWGIGQGLIQAGDQILQYALLPDAAEASRYVGVANVWTALGGVVGSGVCGALLHLFGHRSDLPPGPREGPGYSFLGYVAVFGFAVVATIGTGRVIATIKGSSTGSAGHESTRVAKAV